MTRQFQGMARSIDQWRNMEPLAVVTGSLAQVEYALKDAKHDIDFLWRRASDLERELKHTRECLAGKFTGTAVMASVDDLERFANTPWDEVRSIVQKHLNAYADEIMRRLMQVKSDGNQEEASISNGEAGQGSGEGGD